MKTIMIKTKNAVVTLLCVAALAGLWACEADPVETERGNIPDKDPLENTYGLLRSRQSPGNQVGILLTRGSTGEMIDNIFYQITRPATEALSYDIRVDETLCDAFNEANGTDMKLLPQGNYNFTGGQKLSIAVNGRKSDVKQFRVNANGLEAGEYLLPVTVVKAGADPQNEWQTIYYRVTIREPQVGDSELNDDQVFLVGYIDVSIYQPLLVDDYFMTKMDMTTYQTVWYRTIGNLINLSAATIDNEPATGRAMLNLGSDVRYVLGQATKYIRPLQDKGRKVCLCISGGGTGLGFCNLTDEQIADFTAQVKVVVETYELDGVNLWDKDSGYGLEGMPAMNTTSYPKLIVALRNALGEGKLLTVTDHMEPTSYFWDTTATDGIKVGEYIDYAWSGYRDNTVPVVIVDPWHPDVTNATGEKLVFEGTHKPFAGLDPAKYGCLNLPWYTIDPVVNRIFEWKDAKCKQSNILVLDLRTMLQDNLESTWAQNLQSFYENFADDGKTGSYELFPGFWLDQVDNSYMLDAGRLGNTEGNRYNKWLKDW